MCTNSSFHNSFAGRLCTTIMFLVQTTSWSADFVVHTIGGGGLNSTLNNYFVGTLCRSLGGVRLEYWVKS